MKKVAVLFFTGIFFALLTKYVVENLSPFNLTALGDLVQQQNIKPGDWAGLSNQINIVIKNGQIFKYFSANIILAAICILASIFCFFTSLHLTIEKVFFKNYYEKASMFDAVRRGILVCLAFFLFVFLKLYGIDLSTIILVPIFILLIEIIFTLYLKKGLVERVEKIREFNRKIKEQDKNKVPNSSVQP